MNVEAIFSEEKSPTGRETKEESKTSSASQGNQKEMLEKIKGKLFKQERERLVKIVKQIRQSPELNSLFNTAVAAIREELQASRVLIYRFDDESSGKAIAESLELGWTPAKGETIPCLCFGAPQASDYQSREIALVEKADRDRSSPYQMQLMEKFQVKSSIALPISIDSDDFSTNNLQPNNRVWGLLVAQQCQEKERWQEADINLLYHLATEVSLALQPSQLYSELEQQIEQEKAIAKIIQKIQQSTELYEIFWIATQESRQLISAERVVVYRFNPDWSGEVVAESVDYRWISVMEMQKSDATLHRAEISSDPKCNLRNFQAGELVDKETYLQQTKEYSKGKRFQIVNDIQAEGISSYYLQSLEKYQAKAFIIVPIFQNDRLWGLFAAYQNSGTRDWKYSEVNLMLQLSAALGIAIKQAEYIKDLQKKVEQEQTVDKIVERISQSLDINDIFRTATKEVRKLLNADRVMVYRFNPDWSGEVIAESVESNWISVMELQKIDKTLYSSETSTDERCTLTKLQASSPLDRDTYFVDNKGGDYIKGKKFKVVNDIYAAGFSPCYVESLEKCQVKAYAIVPIFQDKKLQGLFAAYQNSGPRYWDKSEIDLMLKVAPQLSFALQQAGYVRQIQFQAKQLEKTVKRERGLARMLERMQGAKTTEVIFPIVTQETRKLLETNLVAIYRFNPDWSGEFVSESAAGGRVSLINNSSHYKDISLQQNKGGIFKNSLCLAIHNIKSPPDEACHLELLEELEIEAYMVAPIFVEEKLWGLVGAYHSLEPRVWEEDELNALKQVGVQVGIALQQIEYLEQLHVQSDNLARTLEREKAAKEKLQRQAVQMLTNVKPAFKGDLTVRASVTDDEIGTIAGAYNTTLDALRDIVVQVKTTVEQVASTVTDSNVAIEGLSTQAQKQFRELSNALAKIQDMLDSTKVTTENAKKVAVAIEQANKTVQAGDKAMNFTVESILGIRQTVAEAGKRVKRLTESSQKISKVVSLIGSFATQTNLLALNAALEATRAGEYGKGFAVVADEVRNLSLQSAEATKEIEKLVQSIQEDTDEVEAAMERGIEQVVEGNGLVNETRQNLNEIVAATAEISKLVEGITDAASNQTKQAGSVTEMMKAVAAIANETSTDSLKISASFQKLLTMARELQANIARFKVS